MTELGAFSPNKYHVSQWMSQLSLSLQKLNGTWERHNQNMNQDVDYRPFSD